LKPDTTASTHKTQRRRRGLFEHGLNQSWCSSRSTKNGSNDEAMRKQTEATTKQCVICLAQGFEGTPVCNLEIQLSFRSRHWHWSAQRTGNQCGVDERSDGEGGLQVQEGHGSLESIGLVVTQSVNQHTMKPEDAADFEQEAKWVTPDPSRTPHCKVCKTQGCMHFRRGFAHLLALNQVRPAPKGPARQTFSALPPPSRGLSLCEATKQHNDTRLCSCSINHSQRNTRGLWESCDVFS